MSSLLSIADASAYYGTNAAFQELSMEVKEGEAVILVGANGAGKTSVLMSIMGQLKLKAGSIHFMGNRLDNLPAYEIVRHGIALVPEGRRVFPRLSVLNNLRMGAYHNRDAVKENSERVYDMFPVLKEREGQMAGNLSGGQQQMLAIGRALMSSPKLLMLDEPSLGLAPNLVESVMETVGKIRSGGVSVLLVEQNVSAALTVADRGYVLQNGKVVRSGSAAMLEKDDLVAAYLY